MKSLREKRKEELKEKIFMTSMRLFLAQGYENTTVSEIAEACSMAKGTFFNYFPKKEAVLFYFGEIQYKRVEQLANMLVKQGLPANDVLQKIFRDLLDKTQENPNLTKTLILEALKSGSLLEEEYNNQVILTKIIGQVLLYGQEKGVFKQEYNYLEIAENLVALYLHICIQWANKGTDDIYSRWARTLDSYLKGLLVCDTGRE